jgi:hypothetical protein
MRDLDNERELFEKAGLAASNFGCNDGALAATTDVLMPIAVEPDTTTVAASVIAGLVTIGGSDEAPAASIIGGQGAATVDELIRASAKGQRVGLAQTGGEGEALAASLRG